MLSQQRIVTYLLWGFVGEDPESLRNCTTNALGILAHWKGALRVQDLRRVLACCLSILPKDTTDNRQWCKYVDRGFRHVDEPRRKLHLTLTRVRQILRAVEREGVPC